MRVKLWSALPSATNMAGSEVSGHNHNIKECTLDTLQACTFCGRRFIPSSLEKHSKICQRTFINKRKVFNSQNQRIKDASKNAISPSRSPEQNKNATYLKSRWREKHADLISTVRAARGIAVAQLNGKPLPPVPRSLIPSDYIMCEFCNRHFSLRAADRHIEWCKEQKSRIGQSPKVALLARERLEARIKYKAPTFRRKNIGKGNSKMATKVQSEKDCKDPHGKPPVHGSMNRANDVNDHLNVRVRGLSVSPPQKAASRDTPSSQKNTTTTTNSMHRNDSHVQGRNLQSKKQKNTRDGYNPYVAAEQQMRDLLEGSSEASRGQLSRTKQYQDGRAQSHIGYGSMSNQHSKAHENVVNRDTRPPPPVRRTTIQVRDKEHNRLALADLTKHSSGQSAYAYSDSDEESLTPYSERGSGDLRATYTLVSSDKVNRNESTNTRLRKSNGHFGSRSSLASQESDSSSIMRRRNTPSPPLKLPSANPAKNKSQSSSRSSSNILWQHGRSTARACDNEQRLSTSSSDSSLPPLNNNNNNQKNRSRNKVNSREGRTACFCHECGTCYPLPSAKFCCECGTRRLILI